MLYHFTVMFNPAFHAAILNKCIDWLIDYYSDPAAASLAPGPRRTNRMLYQYCASVCWVLTRDKNRICFDGRRYRSQ